MKSYVTQQICHAISIGSDIFGLDVVKARRVFYMQAEIPRQEFRDRTRAFNVAWPGSEDEVYLSRPYSFRIKRRDQTKEILENIMVSEAQFTVLDPVTQIYAGSENNDEHAKYFTDEMDFLREQTETCLNIVHHSRKSLISNGREIDMGVSEARGSSVLTGWPDVVIRVLKRPGGIILKWEKMRHGELHPDVWLNFDKEKEIVVLSRENPSQISNEILAAGPLEITDFDARLRSLLGNGQHAARAIRLSAVEAGYIEEVKLPGRSKKKAVQLIDERSDEVSSNV